MSSFADEGGSAVSKMGADASLKTAEIAKDLVAAGINHLIYLNSAEHKLAKIQVQEYIDKLTAKAAQLEKQSEIQQEIQPIEQVEKQIKNQSEAQIEKQLETQEEKCLENQSENKTEEQREKKHEKQQEKKLENRSEKQSEKQLEKQPENKHKSKPEKQQTDKKRTIKVKPMTMERWHKLTKAERKALPVDAGIARVIAKDAQHKGAIEKVSR